MRVLRVLLPAPSEASRADAWAVFDSEGCLLERGRGPLATWPVADRREAVLAADAVRIVLLVLPPLPRSRRVAAATYALEDRLASAADEAVAVGEQRSDGRVQVIIVSRELADALGSASPPFNRAIAEPELVAEGDGWHWCEGVGGSFVRTHDGAAFPVSRTRDDALPAELALALAHAARDGHPAERVTVHRPADRESLAAWERAAGVPFHAGAPWHWDAAGQAAYANATDVLAAVRRPLASTTSHSGYMFALKLAVVALALHVIATLGSWTWQRIELARAERALIALAQQAGARSVDPGNAHVAIAQLLADARHRAGLWAPGDAVAVLARAAPALAQLPANALKTATWSGGAWTLELAPLDDSVLGRFASRLANAGLASLHAKTPAGVRARVTDAP